jgi:hypothetical protein
MGAAMTDTTPPVAVVRNMAKGHDLLARVIHRARHGQPGRCNACDIAASDTLAAIVEVTPEGRARERFVTKQVLDPRWTLRTPIHSTTEIWDENRRGLRVIRSEALQSDWKHWLHVSVSRRDRHLPTWEQLGDVKDVFIGTSAEAYSVLPPADRYVNLNQGVLHLWACVDEPDGVLPEFTNGTGSL